MIVVRMIGGIIFLLMFIVPNLIHFRFTSMLASFEEPPKAKIYTGAGLPQLKLRSGFEAQHDRDLFDELSASTGLEVAGVWSCTRGCKGRGRLVVLRDRSDMTDGKRKGSPTKYSALRKTLWDNDKDRKVRTAYASEGSTTRTNAFREMAIADVGSTFGRLYIAAQVEVDRRQDAETLVAEAFRDISRTIELR